MKKIKPSLWITDPWNTLDHPNETTLRLIEESIRLGRPCAWADVKSIRYVEGRVLIDACAVDGVYPGRAVESFKLAPPAPLEPRAFTQIHYRVDPPTDLAYTQPLQLLLAAPDLPEVVNPIDRLLGLNEKLEPLGLGEFSPPSVVASERQALLSFLKTERRAVLKPLHQAQSKGVELLDFAGADAALERATENFTRPIILQSYLEGIHEGETRLWFVDGRLIAHAKKRPAPGEFKVDMDRGGTLALSTLTAQDERAAAAISKRLLATGIRLAAVDLIDSRITDWNLTSPGLIVQMEKLLGENLAERIMTAL